MRHFDEHRKLVNGSPCELWDDIEHQPSMDLAWYEWLQPQWKNQFEAWIEKQKVARKMKPLKL
jgi:hypothetical protein